MSRLPSPSQQLSLSNRSPAPVFISDHFRSAQSVPHSNLTSASSQFLTPPATESVSPPPRSEADDYLLAKRRKHNGKFRVRPRRQQLGPRDPSDTASSLKLLSSNTSTIASTTTYSESLGSVGEAAEFSSAPDEPSDIIQRRPTYLDQLLRDRMQPLSTLREGRASTGQFVASDAESESPAIDSLRRLSQSGQTPSFDSIRRPSHTLTSAVGRFRPQLSGKDEGRLTNENTKRRSKRSLSQCSTQTNYLDEHHGRLDHRGIPDSPATITLRKASVVPISQGGDASETSDRPRANLFRPNQVTEPKIQSSELLAFRTTMLATSDKRSTTSEGTLEEEVVASVSSGSQGRSDKRTLRGFLPKEDANARPRSNTVGTALTVADVYVAPGTFAVAPKSRRASVAVGQLARRISVVQFRSRDSVHEVIWREDESTSDSASSTGFSPQQAEVVSKDDVTTRQFEGSLSNEVKPGHLVHNGLESSPAANESLFQWSWGKEPSAGRSQLAEQSTEPIQFTVRLSRSSQSRSPDFGQRSHQVSVTLEGHERAEIVYGAKVADRETAFNEDAQRLEKRRALSISAQVLPKTGELGRMGSSIGSSSGVRRISSATFAP